MYAVLVDVEIAPGRQDESITRLHEHLVPMYKAAPGFMRGTWFGNETSGHGVMVFDSEQAARQMTERLSAAPPDAPARITGFHMYEVHAET